MKKLKSIKIFLWYEKKNISSNLFISNRADLLLRRNFFLFKNGCLNQILNSLKKEF